MSEPRSIEAEQSVLGALLLDGECIDRVGDLRVEHFHDGRHRAVYAAIVAMAGQGKATDAVSVFEQLRDRGQDDSEILPYLVELTSATPSTAGVARYAEVVRGRALERGLIAAGSKIVELAHEPGAVNEKLDRAQRELEQLADQRVRREPVRLGDYAGQGANVLQDRHDGKVVSIATGYADLDRYLSGGLARQNIVVIAARPSMGKTALAQCVANAIAERYGVLMLSMEMSKQELFDRGCAQIGRVPLDWILQPNGGDQHWPMVTAALKKMDTLNLFIDDEGGLTLLDVRLKARAHKRKHGLDVLVIDYIQLMNGGGRGDNRNAEIEEISRGLKSLAKELDIVVIVLSQLNRGVESRTNKRPMLSDLRDSGAIEQDADVVIFLYAEEKYNPDTEEWKGIREVIFGKNRQGQTGTVYMSYIGHLTRFENFTGKVPSFTAPKKTGDTERF